MATKKIKDINARRNFVERFVARWANQNGEGYDDGAAGALRDLLYGGCASGMVGELIYTSDIVAFYKRHMEDVEAVIEETENSMGEPLKRPDNLNHVTFRVWVAVEETARKLADEIGVEV